MSKSKPKQDVTEYRMSIHYGICAGPVDYISQIIVNEKVAWTGLQDDLGAIEIDNEDLFGGPKKEGGVKGTATFLPGASDQTLSEFLAGKYGRTTATMPAYRGIATLFFTENSEDDRAGFFWTANQPYLPGTWVKVARTSVGLNADYAKIWRGLSAGGAEVVLSWWQNTFDQATSPSSNDEAKMGFSFLDANGDQIGDTVEAAYDAPTDWTERSVSGTIPDGAVTLRVFMDMLRNAGFNNDGYIDDISLTIDGESTVLINPGAETGDGTGWTISLGTLGIRSASPAPHSGTYYFYGGSTLSNVSHVYQDIFIGEFDSNPAHIIYECLTNTEWGMGAASSQIDVDGFEDAAQTLYEEGFGLSLIWTAQTTIEAFVSEILDHIEATLFVDPQTGLLTLKLIRDDYVVDDLPVFTPDNSTVTKFSRKLWGETVNEINVTWTNPENEEEETVTAQDLANIAAQGGVVSDNRNYYGVRSKTLAIKLAQRDLRAAATPLASCDIEINREGYSIKPGDVIVLDSEDDGVSNLVMRVGPVDYGKPTDSTIRASLVEDIFSLPVADYTVPPDTSWEDESEQPSAAANTLVFTLPYYLVANEVDPSVSDVEYPEVFAGVLASQTGSDTHEFELYGDVTDSTGTTSTGDLGTKTIASRATLASALDAEVETIISSFPGRTTGNGPTVGGLILIEGTNETDSELCLVSAYGGSPAAYTLKRGVLDTVPREWPVGTPVWFIDSSMTFSDDTVRSEAESVDYQVLPRTSLGLLPLSSAPVVTETLTARPHLPLRPANVKVNSDDGFAGTVDVIGVNPIPVTWVRRNRVTEDSAILAWDATDVTPETSQTTTVTLTDLDGVELHSYTAIAGTSQNVDPADFGSVGEGYIVVTSELDSLESLQGYRVRVLVQNVRHLEDDTTVRKLEDGTTERIFE